VTAEKMMIAIPITNTTSDLCGGHEKRSGSRMKSPIVTAHPVASDDAVL
jgi:hypothetical protein